MSNWVRAHTNIALIKYWGKENENVIIPMNNSLSLTLDAFYTETNVTFNENLTTDELYLDNQIQDFDSLLKVKTVLDLVRKKAGIKTKARVDSFNYVPTAAGFASSASGLAALAGSASLAAGLNLSQKNSLRSLEEVQVQLAEVFMAVLLNGRKVIVMKHLLLFP